MAYRKVKLTAEAELRPLDARLKIAMALARAARARHGEGSTLSIAAAKLGVSRATLQRLMAQLKVEAPLSDRRALGPGRARAEKAA